MSKATNIETTLNNVHEDISDCDIIYIFGNLKRRP